MKRVRVSSPKVTRGAESWTYFYVALGFAISIESTVISMIDPLIWYGKLIVFAIFAGVSIWLFGFNRWFQNVLIGFKNRIESKAR